MNVFMTLFSEQELSYKNVVDSLVGLYHALTFNQDSGEVTWDPPPPPLAKMAAIHVAASISMGNNG